MEVRNIFKGLDLIDSMPDELWMEVRDIVQETEIKTIHMEKKCKKAKWLSGEGLQIAVKKREVKSKGEKERYTHLNAKFQRIARTDKKAILLFLHFFFLGMILISVSCTMAQTSVHSSSCVLFIESSPLNIFLTSTV